MRKKERLILKVGSGCQAHFYEVWGVQLGHPRYGANTLALAHVVGAAMSRSVYTQQTYGLDEREITLMDKRHRVLFVGHNTILIGVQKMAIRDCQVVACNCVWSFGSAEVLDGSAL